MTSSLPSRVRCRQSPSRPRCDHQLLRTPRHAPLRTPPPEPPVRPLLNPPRLAVEAAAVEAAAVEVLSSRLSRRRGMQEGMPGCNRPSSKGPQTLGLLRRPATGSARAQRRRKSLESTRGAHQEWGSSTTQAGELFPCHRCLRDRHRRMRTRRTRRTPPPRRQMAMCRLGGRRAGMVAWQGGVHLALHLESSPCLQAGRPTGTAATHGDGAPSIRWRQA